MKINIKEFFFSLLLVISSIGVFISSTKSGSAINLDKATIYKEIITTKKDTVYYNRLIDSISDLEQKAEILNRYLMAKNLEYIEVCNLTYKKK